MTKQAITIRPARLSDLPTLHMFEQGVVEAERPLIHNLKDSGVNYYDIEKLITDKKSHLVVAETDKVLVASGYARLDPAKAYLTHNQHAYLGFMYVDPNYRGLGLINKILEALITWSKSKHVGEIMLEVYDGNEQAMRAYQKAGFRTYVHTMRLGV